MNWNIIATTTYRRNHTPKSVNPLQGENTGETTPD